MPISNLFPGCWELNLFSLIRLKADFVLFSPSGDASESSEHGDQCAMCSEGGELLCCDTCPLAYHIQCAYPPLRRIPRGNWACQVCTGADEERPRSCRVKKATIEGENAACPSSWDRSWFMVFPFPPVPSKFKSDLR